MFCTYTAFKHVILQKPYSFKFSKVLSFLFSSDITLKQLTLTYQCMHNGHHPFPLFQFCMNCFAHSLNVESHSPNIKACTGQLSSSILLPTQISPDENLIQRFRANKGHTKVQSPKTADVNMNCSQMKYLKKLTGL